MSPHIDPETTARAIVEAMLKRTSDAILDNDFGTMNACFALPFTVETAEEKLTVTTEDEHRAMFDRLVEGYRTKNVTEIIRVCEVAEFVTPLVIRSLHISHLMAGNLRVDEPMPTLATTQLIDGAWRITSAQYAASSSLPVGRAIVISSRAKSGEPS